MIDGPRAGRLGPEPIDIEGCHIPIFISATVWKGAGKPLLSSYECHST
jgi:hypothetical protein